LLLDAPGTNVWSIFWWRRFPKENSFSLKKYQEISEKLFTN
jgi:hypothetical protein